MHNLILRKSKFSLNARISIDSMFKFRNAAKKTASLPKFYTAGPMQKDQIEEIAFKRLGEINELKKVKKELAAKIMQLQAENSELRRESQNCIELRSTMESEDKETEQLIEKLLELNDELKQAKVKNLVLIAKNEALRQQNVNLKIKNDEKILNRSLTQAEVTNNERLKKESIALKVSIKHLGYEKYILMKQNTKLWQQNEVIGLFQSGQFQNNKIRNAINLPEVFYSKIVIKCQTCFVNY